MTSKKKKRSRENPVKKAFQIEKYTPEQILELARCAEDFIYFSTNYVHIQHPTKGKVLFKPYEYQEEILKSFIDYSQQIFMCGRQLGKCKIDKTKININGEEKNVGELLWESLSTREKIVTILERWLVKLRLKLVK